MLCSNLSNENSDMGIINFYAGHRFPTLSLGAKGIKLTFPRVTQENLAEMEIWATTLGYT